MTAFTHTQLLAVLSLMFISVVSVVMSPLLFLPYLHFLFVQIKPCQFCFSFEKNQLLVLLVFFTVFMIYFTCVCTDPFLSSMNLGLLCSLSRFIKHDLTLFTGDFHCNEFSHVTLRVFLLGRLFATIFKFCRLWIHCYL